MKAYACGISKTDFVAELKKHQAADAFMSGTYGNTRLSHFRGCAVGCSLESVSRLKGVALRFDDHSLYPKHLGIPLWLATVEDRIFEGVSPERRKTWPVEFGEAINEGANLSKALYPYLILICTGALNHFDPDKYPEVKKSIDGVIEALRVGVTDQDQLKKLREATNAAYYAAANAAYARAVDAAAAAYYAAEAAHYAVEADAIAVADAVEAANTNAAYYAVEAANAIAEAAAASAYRTRIYELLADGLLEILRSTK